MNQKVSIKTEPNESSPDVTKVKVKKQLKEPVVPAHLAAILAMKAQEQPAEEMSKAYRATTAALETTSIELPTHSLHRQKNRLEPDSERSLIGVDWDKQSRLVLEFDDGEKLVSSPVPVNEIRSASVMVASGGSGGGSGGIAESFETVNKNLSASNGTFAYNLAGDLSSIVYTNGITKTLNYTIGVLTSVVLSGSTPSGIDLTKSFTYTSGNLTQVTYS